MRVLLATAPLERRAQVVVLAARVAPAIAVQSTPRSSASARSASARNQSTVALARRRGLARLVQPLAPRTGGPSRAAGSAPRRRTPARRSRATCRPAARADPAPRRARRPRRRRPPRPPPASSRRRTPTAAATAPARARVEQLVAPVDRRAQRLLPRRRRPAAAGQQPEAVVEPCRDLLHGQHATRAAASSSASGMPSSRRQICATAGAFASVSANAGSADARPVDEQPHRLVLVESVAASRRAPSRGRASTATAPARRPRPRRPAPRGWWPGSRTPGHARSSPPPARRRPRPGARSCPSTSSVARRAGARPAARWAAGRAPRPGPSADGRGLRAPAPGRRARARSTNQTPSG